jgi:hypothetical protein
MVVKRFKMSIFSFASKIDEFEALNSDPYNSTLYRFAVASPTPVVFIQTYEKKEVIPLYQVQMPN